MNKGKGRRKRKKGKGKREREKGKGKRNKEKEKGKGKEGGRDAGQDKGDPKGKGKGGGRDRSASPGGRVLDERLVTERLNPAGVKMILPQYCHGWYLQKKCPRDGPISEGGKCKFLHLDEEQLEEQIRQLNPA